MTGWTPMGLATILFSDYTTDDNGLISWFDDGGPTKEFYVWLKQKFVTELNVDDYEAAWDFAQYPLPKDASKKAAVIKKLRMNEMSYADCERLYGDPAIPDSLIKQAVSANKAGTGIKINIDGLNGKKEKSVKFNAKYAGKTAKLYLYNPETKKLSLTAASKIAADGKCTFKSLKQPGSYLAVIK